MSDREKELITNLAALPPDLQDKFADMAAGAAMVVELSSKGNKKNDDS